ncbi:Protoheme IX farnesyltransferase [archaeon HR06]|nr:Protoheme IX farnesyltransferase [archaeon HR06]
MIYFGNLSLIYLIFSSILGGLLILQILRLLMKPSLTLYWRIFKLSSPYLALIYLALIMDRTLF